MQRNERREIRKLMGKNFMNDIYKVGFLAVSPIIGNLSSKLRKRLEDRFSKDCYDSVLSGKISAVSNFVVYPLITYSATHNKWLTFASIVYATLERSFRDKRHEDVHYHEYPASFPGKICSLPIEYTVNLYDRAKAQIRSIK